MIQLFFATALRSDQNVTGAFTVAPNPDEAAAKVLARLMVDHPGAVLTHLIAICPASPEALRRNGLDKLLPLSDQIELKAENLLTIIQSQQKQVELLRQQVQRLLEREDSAAPLRKFRYIIVPPWGEVIRCTCNARNVNHAQEQAEYWAADLHPEAKVIGLQENQ